MEATEHVHIVTAYCGEYEPETWLVRAFASQEEAAKFAKDYDDRARAVEQKVSDFCYDNPEPSTEADDDAAYDAWHAWLAAQREIRKEHPDERTHEQIEPTRYFVQQVPFSQSCDCGRPLVRRGYCAVCDNDD